MMGREFIIRESAQHDERALTATARLRLYLLLHASVAIFAAAGAFHDRLKMILDKMRGPRR